jgi:D-inositol-3-phosphate glycosyltransferase
VTGLRIALVHRDLHAVTRGGIGTLYRELAPRLLAAGHEVILVTQHSPRPLALDGIQVITLPRTVNLEAHRQAVLAALVTLAPDIAESSSWEAEALLYARQPRARRAPVVVRGDLSAATMGALPHSLAAAEREFVRAADAVLAVSEFAADDLAAAYSIPRAAGGSR